MKLVQIILA